MVEEKDEQIVSLISKWEAYLDKEPGQDVQKKGPHHEAESSEKGLGHEIKSSGKLQEKGDAALVDANVATIVFGSFDPVPLPALSQRSEFQSTMGIHQVTDLCTKEVAGEPNDRGGDGLVGDLPFNDNEGWTLASR
ncbi:hypothetical protein L3X38_025533 [Prunus dulcis]|uniref:Uncharacterized protein n=1 Tax=Prunus dulcis TaxID=3755 RepID=A0AAD4W1U2_PRUDU|nr:hypothetical protein L3X38_025533 [Prunus dulcis]